MNSSNSGNSERKAESIGSGMVLDSNDSNKEEKAPTAAAPSSKRRAEEIYKAAPAQASLRLDLVSSQDVGVEGLMVSDFEQTETGNANIIASSSTRKQRSRGANELSDDAIGHNNSNITTNATNISNPNSYFCIGSGSGCVDRSVSQTCLTRELDQLPINRREHVGQDLYGLAEECIPTADKTMMDELETAIVRLLEKADSKLGGTAASPRAKKPPGLSYVASLPITKSVPELQALVPYHAYKLALSKNPRYVRSPSFRLMFLRSTEGDAKKAAKRLTRHFKTKLRLFGEDKLVRDIVLDDLSEDDMEALKSGGFQVLKKRDTAGRSILFGRYTSMKYKTIDNMLRALWYIWMSILEDPVNQMKGVVAVGYEVGRIPLDRFGGMTVDESDDDWNEEGFGSGFEMDHLNGGFDRTLAREIVSVPLSVPARPVGYHLCTDSHQWVGILNMVMVTLCKFVRLRMRIHHGTDQECRYALMTHGMPTDCVPVDESGFLSLKNHLEWIDHRMLLDAQKTAAAKKQHQQQHLFSTPVF